jgi:hypothetical protein
MTQIAARAQVELIIMELGGPASFIAELVSSS